MALFNLTLCFSLEKAQIYTIQNFKTSKLQNQNLKLWINQARMSLWKDIGGKYGTDMPLWEFILGYILVFLKFYRL